MKSSSFSLLSSTSILLFFIRFILLLGLTRLSEDSTLIEGSDVYGKLSITFLVPIEIKNFPSESLEGTLTSSGLTGYSSFNFL